MAPRLPRLRQRRVKVDWSKYANDEPAEHLIDLLDPMEARLEKHSAEIEALSGEIRSPLTSAERRIEAVQQRDVMIAARKTLLEEITSLRTRLRASVERGALEIGGASPFPYPSD